MLADPDIEKLYGFVRSSLNRLPRRPAGPKYDFEDDVALKFCRIEKMSEAPSS
jgi:type I restriction enzyme R subunit